MRSGENGVTAGQPFWPGLYAALGAEALAYGCLAGIAAVVHRRNHVRASPPVAELELGDESPALVNFLTHGFHTTGAAAAATIVDMASQGWIEVDEVSSTVAMLRHKQARDERARPYERMVLQELDRRSVHGVVPSEACTLGPSELSRRWWRAFDAAVTSEAVGAGLAESTRGLWADRTDRSAQRVAVGLANVLVVLPVLLVGIGCRGIPASG